jgi:hypothetical protein
MAKMGRPPRDPEGIASKIFPVRLTDAEKDEYARAAKRGRIELGQRAGCPRQAYKATSVTRRRPLSIKRE